MTDYKIINNHGVYLVDAKFPEIDNIIDCKLGISSHIIGDTNIPSLEAYLRRGQLAAYAQFLKIVMPSLILTKHIFRGLKRPLCSDETLDGDKKKLIYTRKPVRDYVWAGGCDGGTVEYPAPPGKVFVVIVGIHIDKEKYPGIRGWIERWNWVEEDGSLQEAPLAWVDRYDDKIYTREGL